ncbi:MAG: ATP-binding protein [Candidatus Omnitrophica bacterium]|nr:ATP-binding protein [Candidatus Omnitrophota bacterium]
MQIKSRLQLGFLGIVIFLIIIVIISLFTERKVHLLEKSISLAYKIKIYLLECRRQEKNMLIRGPTAENIQAHRAALKNIQNTCEALHTKGIISKGNFAKIKQELMDYERVLSDFIFDLKKKAVLSSVELHTYDNRFKDRGRLAESMSDSIIASSERYEQRIHRLMFGLLMLISFSGILFSIILGYITTRTVSRSVNEINRLKGDLENSSIELAVGLSEHFEVLKQVAAGQLNVTAREDSTNELLAKLGEVINQTIQQLINYTRQELEQIYRLTTYGIRLIDTDYNVLRINQAMQDLSGIPLSQLLSRKCYEQLKSPYCHTENCTLKQIMAGKKNVNLDMERVKADGSKIYCQLKAVPFKDSLGNITGILEQLIDITELKQLQIELEDLGIELSVGLSECFEMVKKLTAGDPSARIAVSTNNYLVTKLQTLLNELAQGIEKMVENEHDLAIGLCEHYDTLIRIASGDLNARANESSSNELVAKLGQLINVQNAKFINLLNNLESTRNQLVQSSKMASLGQLAGGVAHEINNPLTGIINNLQLIKMESELKPEFNLEDFKQFLKVIEESALRCKRITHSLLTFSRSPTGSFKPISLNETVTNSIDLIMFEMSLHNIELRQELGQGPLLINADQQLIQQVIMDILSNAKWAIGKKKSEEPGLITVRTKFEPERNVCVLTISDNGIGIPEPDLNKIFEPFFTTKEVGEGTGLGLSLVYNIVKAHKGLIEVQSKVNKGTTFILSFPALKEG